MIVCSCSLITAKDVADAVAAFRSVDPLAALKPGCIYRSLGKCPPCGGCGRLVKELMAFYDQERLSSGIRSPDTVGPLRRGFLFGRYALHCTEV